ncbi:hypothetical protein ACSBR2_036562 [Camellia fascicularis]
MATPTHKSKKRRFVADGVFFAELNEVLIRELAEDGYSNAHRDRYRSYSYSQRSWNMCQLKEVVCVDFVLDYTTQFTTEQVFKNKDELLNWVREVGKRNGLVIVIKTSDYGGGKKRPRMYLACERSGQYRATKKSKHDGNNTSRITGTKKCGCPFDMRAHRLPHMMNGH